MINELLPEIGTSGVFKFKQPFDKILGPTTKYTCKSIRKISELLSKSESVYEEYYKKNSLTGDSYSSDLSNDVSIVGLFSAKGVWFYVPASYILSYPDNTGVIYRRMILGVELGPMADIIDLTSLKTTIADVVYNNVGIKPEIREIAVSQLGLVKAEDHLLIENSRKAKITVDKPLSLVVTELTKERDRLYLQNKALETFIKNNLASIL